MMCFMEGRGEREEVRGEREEAGLIQVDEIEIVGHGIFTED